MTVSIALCALILSWGLSATVLKGLLAMEETALVGHSNNTIKVCSYGPGW